MLRAIMGISARAISLAVRPQPSRRALRLSPVRWAIKTSCSLAFNEIALLRSVPNGFSMMIRDRSSGRGALQNEEIFSIGQPKV
jgi:hypothetical protein